MKAPWELILLFGGGFALGSAFETSGLSGYIGKQLTFLAGVHELLLASIVSLTLTSLTEICSNTATANIMMPVLAAFARAANAHPLLLMVPGALACSFSFALPTATAPNVIVFASKNVTIREMMLSGAIVNVIAVVVSVAMVFLWAPIAFNFSVSGGMPAGWPKSVPTPSNATALFQL